MSKSTSRSSSKSNQTQPPKKRPTTRTAKTNTRKPIQFNWRKHWEKKVKPHLDHPCVQMSLGVGMVMIDPTWKDGDAPYELGDDIQRRAKKGTLAWYQPRRQCHGISLFAMAIGVINYPSLRWKFVSGRCHTVPVGYDENGQARVVMDILLFDKMTAVESIDFALLKKHSACRLIFRGFETKAVPAIRKSVASKDSVYGESCFQAYYVWLKQQIKRSEAKSKTSGQAE
jgi:hypothetical protein